MTDKDYVDFDLLLAKQDGKYRAHLLNSIAGPATHIFTLPFSDLELENFILRIGQGRRRVRRLQSQEMETAKEFGKKLFAALFGGEVGNCLQSSISEAGRTNSGVRIRLRLSDTPELLDVPWEFLYDASVNRFLALSVDTPLVRYLDLPGRIKPLLVTPPLRILVMIASPSDYTNLDVEQEWQKLKSAVVDLEQQGLLSMDRVEVATLDALLRQLRRASYHIFHFIGHGGFDEAVKDGVLLLEDGKGRGHPVSGQTLGMILHDEKSLRLALLNACEGGRTAKNDPFAGVGQSLLQQGIPAVIAMQFEVTDETSITLTHAFYAALADGYPVDAALSEARKAIFAQNDVEWGTPVLYMRSPDGCIFDIPLGIPKVERDPESPAAALYRLAQVAMAAEDWKNAERHLKQLLALEPAYPGATDAMQTVKKRLAPPEPPPGKSIWLTIAGVAIVLAIAYLFWQFLPGGMGAPTSTSAVDPSSTVTSIAIAAPADTAAEAADPPATATAVQATPTTLPATPTATTAPTHTPTSAPTPIPTPTLPVLIEPHARPLHNGLLIAPNVELLSAQARILIDGNREDWRTLQDEQGIVPTQMVNVYTNPNAPGCEARYPGAPAATDLAGSVLFAYDSTYLYVSFEIDDDGYVSNPDPTYYWKGDAPQLLLDIDMAQDFYDRKTSVDEFQVDLSPGQHQIGPQPSANQFTVNYNRARLFAEAKVAASATSTGYFLEAALPWSDLNNFQPSSGLTLGVAPGVSDNDTPDALRQECMFSAAPNRAWGNPTTWATLLLR